MRIQAERAISKAAQATKADLPPDLVVDAEVDLGNTDCAFLLQARLNVSMPGVPRDIGQALIDMAHQMCPYSKATRGNINVVIQLV
jgi:osmotically inducible protein OsmC